MIKTIRRAWDRLCIPSWTTPVGLLVLLGISFGPLIPALGFYWDDWPVILTAQLHGTDGFWRFFEYNRPFSAWIYIVTFPIMGTKPLHWQIFALALRWLTCVGLWWALTLTWPRQKHLTAWIVFLFAIYPIFAQQSISVAYTQHWVSYLLFTISLGGMLLAQRLSHRGSRWYWPVVFLSVAAFLLEIFSMEYFTGLELLRPFLLWIVAAELFVSRSDRVKSVPKGWFPFLGGAAGFLTWRFFFIRLAEADDNSPRLLSQMLVTPLVSLKRFGEMTLQDLVFLFVRAWTDLINTKIDLSDRFLLLTWGIAMVVMVVTFVYLYRNEDRFQGQPERISVYKQGLLLGAFATVLGILPVWATDRQVTAGMYANRFGLASMLGTSVFLACLIGWLVSDRRKQVMILSLLVGMASAYHLQTANEYRWVWVKQSRFYWQLKWRAPQLEPNTAIFSEGEIFQYVGLYPTSAAINLLYLDRMDTEELSYWFYSLGRDFAHGMPNFLKGAKLSTNLRNYTFQGHTKNGIVIEYIFDNDCLQVLEPGDETAPNVEPFTRQAVQNSNLSRITQGPGNPGTPPDSIFGPEPERGWCYLYQKGSLARQQGDWSQVVALADQAIASGYHPTESSSNTPFEWLPFIEGYAHAGRWQEAQDLSLAAFEKDRRIDAKMCSLWDSLASQAPASQARNSAAAAVRNQIKCP